MNGSKESGERIGRIERVVQAWEDGRDCLIFYVDFGQNVHLSNVVGDVDDRASGSVGVVEDGSVGGDVDLKFSYIDMFLAKFRT